MSVHPCRTPACPGLLPRPGYCDSCRTHYRLSRPAATAAGSKWSDWAQGTSTQRGYGAPWRRLRDAVLRREPLCRRCLATADRPRIATEVHHILPKARGGTDDLENLEPTCAECHRAVTASMQSSR
jgi:5-methylcytosine-specific restriction protein A